ncbi:Pyruvate dehydrogenase E1 component subunit beta, partial [Tetrabaena socialis]
MLASRNAHAVRGQRMAAAPSQRSIVAARPGRRAMVAAKAAKKEIMMWEALREAHDEEMERDPMVCVMGEDVGHYGGSYKCTYGLYKKYGDMRVLDTPICGARLGG